MKIIKNSTAGPIKNDQDDCCSDCCSSDDETNEMIEMQRLNAQCIDDFPGTIISLGGTAGELSRLSELALKYKVPLTSPLHQQIYTVNNKSRAKPDLLADFSSLKAMQALPDKRFDIVYFAHVPTKKFDYRTAFIIASRIIKDDGILLFSGGVFVNSYAPESRRYLPKNVYDTTGALALAGFKRGKPIHEVAFTQSPFGFYREKVATNGELLIASKSTEPFDLEARYRQFPILKAIVKHVLFRNPYRLVAELNDEPKWAAEERAEKYLENHCAQVSEIASKSSP